MLRLQTVQEKDRDLFWNINQKYLYEMTYFYDDPMDESGNYHYGHFDDYFTDQKRRAYFIYDEDVLVGFAMICPYSNINQNPDYTMAEFTIFPAYRRKHFALDAVEMILDKHPGKWEIKYNEKNDGAKKLWNTVAMPYCPEVHHLNEEETVLAFEVRKKMETQRLILRRWEDSDAEDLYKYASNPDVGPIAGWPPHQSVDESRNVIKNVLSGKEAYAICLKEDGKVIGAIELKLNGHTDMTERDDECEMGYWLGKPFWGQGIMPEAVKEMLLHAFEDCGMQKVWIGYYEGNNKSKRVQEKCGFKYQWRSEDVDVPLMHEKRTGHVSLMTKEDWMVERKTRFGETNNG